MNVENVKAAISIMERARHRQSLNMFNWQTAGPGAKVCRTEEELHACGNKACFAGHIAISPEFRNSGGFVDTGHGYGAPMLQNAHKNAYSGVYAIEQWLEISQLLADSLVFGDTVDENDGDDYEFSRFYGKVWADVTADDVIAKLNAILNGELQ